MCAIARLVIGSGHGLTRREAVWNGKCQAQAALKSCDYELWYNAGILGIWPQLADS